MRMKRTATVGGGLVLVGLALGMLLNLFRGPGGGDEGTNVMARSSGETSLSQSDPGADVPVTNASQEQPISSEPAAPAMAPVAQPLQVVRVVVEDREYKLRRTGSDGQEQLQPIALAELIELVRGVSGDEDGVRVRIVRHDSSRAAAEELLRQRLIEAGVAETAMVWND